MAHKRGTLVVATLSLLVLGAVLIGATGSPAETNAAAEKENGDPNRSNRERIHRLKSALVHNLSKVSAIERERQRRFQSILSAIVGETDVLVLELAQLRATPIGNRTLECLLRADPSAAQTIQSDWGIDLRSDVRRIAIADEFVLMEGRASAAESGRILRGASASEFGTAGTVFRSDRNASSGALNAGIWRKELLVVSTDVEEIHEAVDIAEGRAPPETEPLFAGKRSGQISGTVTPEILLKVLGVRTHLAPILPLLSQAVETVAFDIHVANAVAVKGTVKLRQKEDVPLLMVALEGLRSAFIAQSVAYENDALADLIDSITIRAGNRSIDIEWTMSLEYAVDELDRCDNSEEENG